MTELKHQIDEVTVAKAPALRQSGFSLIEMMMALVTASILLAAVYSVYDSLSKSYTTQNVSAEVQQSIRAAMGLMARDIMMAGLDPQKLGLPTSDFGFEDSGTTQISFKLDSPDPVTNIFSGEVESGAQEYISYRYDAGLETLFQCYDAAPAGCTGTADQFIDHVVDFKLEYFDSDGNDLYTKFGKNPLADLLTAASGETDDIRQVAITIEVEEPAGRSGTVTRTYSTRVKCRNIGI
jgi:prepilin-type N-terminal cleavage/methylation domain-containing protein